MFLKRIEMQGFKSFADRVNIEFDSNMTGIVGPNGCGKSNISDAIRWVLGEQSIKSLRGEKMTDVIFAGSESRKAVNMAEVTLIFDNTTHGLNSDLHEIEITRRIYRGDQEAEYLINRKHVRLKDILNLIVDTGLGKDSLSMISQGNIASFAEAKPFERRAIFEDAAGVAKYKKKKNESLSRLERTRENLERAQDILSELEKQVTPLKKAATKAVIYREKKKKLEEIEIAFLIHSIRNLREECDKLARDCVGFEAEIHLKEMSLNVLDTAISEGRTVLRQNDRQITELQESVVECLHQIQRLELQKVEIDEKRKYALQTGDDKEKIVQIEIMRAEAKAEWDDRQKRFDSTNVEIKLLNNQLDQIVSDELKETMHFNEIEAIVRRIENRIIVLENILKDPFSNRSQLGVKTIMENQRSFPGILGVVGQVIVPFKKYEEAVSAALAGSVYHIIARDSDSARNAIDFLRKNQSGKATFLPMSVLQERYIGKEQLAIAKNSEGFLGSVSDFCECESRFELVKKSLLGNILLCDNLYHANRIAELLKHSYTIVTIEGDIVHRGGTMTGGRIKGSTSIVGAQNELEQAKIELISKQSELKLSEKSRLIAKEKMASIESEITEKRIQLAQLETLIDAKRAKFDKLTSELKSILPDNERELHQNFVDKIVLDLNKAYSRKDQLSTSLASQRNERNKLSMDLERKDLQSRALRKELDESHAKLRDLATQQAVINTKLEDHLLRLTSEYQMTFEYAQEKVSVDDSMQDAELVESLRQDIRNLGNINMTAPEEYEELNKRYQLMKKSCDELISSRDKLLAAIDEMDETMKKRFRETFDLINSELPNIFTALFGGGKAKLVLEDEMDILNTGIDIDVQPPGKSVKSIRLFSGGEKTLIAICVLFTILKIRNVPLILFDEVEAALDEANVERLANYIRQNSANSQFLMITHRPGTMEQCDVLYGVTMQKKGVSQMMKVKLVDVLEIHKEEEKNGLS